MPNASNGHRKSLGLAQLHQLGKGGVTRALPASHAPLSQNAGSRLQALRESQDGFTLPKEIWVEGPQVNFWEPGKQVLQAFGSRIWSEMAIGWRRSGACALPNPPRCGRAGSPLVGHTGTICAGLSDTEVKPAMLYRL